MVKLRLKRCGRKQRATLHNRFRGCWIMTSNISYSDQMPLAPHYSYFIIYSPSNSRFHVIPYKDDGYLFESFHQGCYK